VAHLCRQLAWAALIAVGFIAIAVRVDRRQGVVLDYVHRPWLRLGVLSLVAILLVGVQIRWFAILPEAGAARSRFQVRFWVRALPG
jgi:hypothetical protein